MVDIFQPTPTAPQGSQPIRNVGGGSAIVGGLSVLAGIAGDVAADVRKNRVTQRADESLGILQKAFQDGGDVTDSGPDTPEVAGALSSASSANKKAAQTGRGGGGAAAKAAIEGQPQSVVASPGGVPLPSRMYWARCRAYASTDGNSTSWEGCWDRSKSCLRKGRHQPQPVPAPWQSLNCDRRCGRSTRKKFSTFRLLT